MVCWSTKAAISETRKDRGKVTIEGLEELTNTVSNGTIPDVLRPEFFDYPLLSQEWVKLLSSNFVHTFIGSIGTKAH